MKKLFILLALIASLKNINVNAQIPNGDFETILSDGTLSNWGNITLFAVVIDSTGSVIQDSLVFDGPFCAATTDAYSGNYALEMRNMYNYTANQGFNGWASVDEDSVYTAWGSLEFISSSIRPENFNFFYKYISVNGDSGKVSLAFYDAMGYVIGEASMIFAGTNPYYSYASIPIVYTSNDASSAYSLNFSTYYSAADYPAFASFGTRLTIDDVSFSGTTGIVKTAEEMELAVFPNPCTEFLSVKSSIAADYRIYNMNGQIVQAGKFPSDSKIVLEKKIITGAYTLELKSGGKVARKVFNVN